MNWFRFYHEALDDPKVQRLEPWLFKVWINLLCLANRSAVRGNLPPVADIAFALRMEEREAERAVAELIRRELLDPAPGGFVPHNWSGRQQRSDDINARVRKHRDAKKPEETLRETLPKQAMKQKRNDLEKSREEESRGEDSPPTPPPAAPDEPAERPNEPPPTPSGFDDAPPPVPPPPSPAVHPFVLLEALCDELGQDASDMPKGVKERQLGVAKRLVADGMTEGDLRRMVRWLSRQTWIESGIDLFTVDRQRSKWVLNGKPDAPKPKPPPGSDALARPIGGTKVSVATGFGKHRGT